LHRQKRGDNDAFLDDTDEKRGSNRVPTFKPESIIDALNQPSFLHAVPLLERLLQYQEILSPTCVGVINLSQGRLHGAGTWHLAHASAHFLLHSSHLSRHELVIIGMSE
jgi:hypothetical protein